MAAKAREAAPWKREVISELVGMLESYPVVGILDIADLPAPQFQQVRQKLRGQAEIIVSRNTLLKVSIERAAGRKDPKLRELIDHLHGQTALILAHVNPFKLSKILRESKTYAPARPGSRSPRDIVIPAGETDFAPGPVVGDLQRIGVKARIHAGRVVILEDCQILGEGDMISKEVADALTKFGIMPFELGLKLRAVYEAGMVFSGEVLEFDETKATEQLQLACASAVNLAINANYPTSITIGVMISKASAAARNLALNACLPISEVMPTLLTKAYAEMLSLASVAHGKNEKALDEELKTMLRSYPIPQTKPEMEAKKIPEKPKEERKEEELEGLSKLFG